VASHSIVNYIRSTLKISPTPLCQRGELVGPQHKKTPERQRHSGARFIRGTTRLHQPLAGLSSWSRAHSIFDSQPLSQAKRPRLTAYINRSAGSSRVMFIEFESRGFHHSPLALNSKYSTTRSYQCFKRANVTPALIKRKYFCFYTNALLQYAIPQLRTMTSN